VHRTVDTKARKAKAEPRRRAVTTTPVAPPRMKGPYVFPEAGTWSDGVSRDPEPLVLVGLAALLLAFGSASLALTVTHLRAHGA
jgi:hypothetical protein